MLSAHYTLASGILTRQREIDVVGNNLVNAQTPGYRAEHMVTGSFEQILAAQQGNSTQVLNTSMSTAAVVDDVVSLFHTGLIQATERNLDMAINGEGFFVVDGTDGEEYLTRSGKFDIDESGHLILPGIGRVQGTNGDILVRDSTFTVDADGTIKNSEGNRIANMQVVTVADNSTLVKNDNGMYQIQAGGATTQAAEFNMVQGSVELSNVDMNAELTHLIDVQRAFQSCSSAIQSIDAMNRKAVSQLGAL